MNIIGQTCDQCDRIISADDDEAHQYYREIVNDDGTNVIRILVPGVYCCCYECQYELEDADRAAMADDMERGLDYPD